MVYSKLPPQGPRVHDVERTLVTRKTPFGVYFYAYGEDGSVTYAVVSNPTDGSGDMATRTNNPGFLKEIGGGRRGYADFDGGLFKAAG